MYNLQSHSNTVPLEEIGVFQLEDLNSYIQLSKTFMVEQGYRCNFFLCDGLNDLASSRACGALSLHSVVLVCTASLHSFLCPPSSPEEGRQSAIHSIYYTPVHL